MIAAFSIRLTVSVLGLLDYPVSTSEVELVDCGVCLALDFIQDQESVKKGPLGAQNTVLIACLTVGIFVSFGACGCCCECVRVFTFIPTQELVHSTPNWLIV